MAITTFWNVGVNTRLMLDECGTNKHFKAVVHLLVGSLGNAPCVSMIQDNKGKQFQVRYGNWQIEQTQTYPVLR